MREPIERSWSRVVKILALRRKKSIQDASRDEIYQELNNPQSIMRGDHLEVIKKLESVFPPEQLFLTFYEEISIRPEKLILDVFKFLNVDASDKFVPPDVRSKVNASGKYKAEIPTDIELYIAKQHFEHITKLRSRFDDPVEQWLQRANAILSRGG